MEGDKRFRELIDRSFVEEVSEGERQLIHDHIRDCDSCKRYLCLLYTSLCEPAVVGFGVRLERKQRVLDSWLP